MITLNFFPLRERQINGEILVCKDCGVVHQNPRLNSYSAVIESVKKAKGKCHLQRVLYSLDHRRGMFYGH